jgi:hypothetical protein
MLDVPSVLAASPRARSIHSVPSRSVSVLVLSLHLALANSDVGLTSSDNVTIYGYQTRYESGSRSQLSPATQNTCLSCQVLDSFVNPR